MGPRMMALPCPAHPNDTALTPSYSTGVMACAVHCVRTQGGVRG